MTHSGYPNNFLNSIDVLRKSWKEIDKVAKAVTNNPEMEIKHQIYYRTKNRLTTYMSEEGGSFLESLINEIEEHNLEAIGLVSGRYTSETIIPICPTETSLIEYVFDAMVGTALLNHSLSYIHFLATSDIYRRR